MPGNCKFQKHWLEISTYGSWLQQDPKSVHQASCVKCIKDLDIGNTGEAAIKSHVKLGKHVTAMTNATTMKQIRTVP